jgi:hypothetical protein
LAGRPYSSDLGLQFIGGAKNLGRRLPFIKFTLPFSDLRPLTFTQTISTLEMTTNLNAIAGPSKFPSPKVEADSPTPTELREMISSMHTGSGGTKGGLNLGEDGEVVKVPAFLNKLFRYV